MRVLGWHHLTVEHSLPFVEWDPRRLLHGLIALVWGTMVFLASMEGRYWYGEAHAWMHSQMVIEQVAVLGPVKRPGLRPVVQQVLDLRGRQLDTLSLEGLRRDLSQSPWVKSVTATKRWPSTLIVEIQPRVPVAWLMVKGQRMMMDAEGMLLPPDRPVHGLPHLRLSESTSGSPAMMVKFLSGLANEPGHPKLTSLEATPGGLWLAKVSSLPFPVLLEPGASPSVLQKFLDAKPGWGTEGQQTTLADLRYFPHIYFQEGHLALPE